MRPDSVFLYICIPNGQGVTKGVDAIRGRRRLLGKLAHVRGKENRRGVVQPEPACRGAFELPPVQVRLSRPLSQGHYVTQRARFESGVITTAVTNVRAPADSPIHPVCVHYITVCRSSPYRVPGPIYLITVNIVMAKRTPVPKHKCHGSSAHMRDNNVRV